MNSLVLLPLLAAACMAAPSPQWLAAPGQQVVLSGVAPVAVQVPVTKTVHFDVRNVVTGVQTNILKPSLSAPVIPQLAAPALVAAPGQNLFAFQLPSVPAPEIPGANNNGTAQFPGGDQNPINNFPGAPGGPPAPQPDPNNPPQLPGQQPPPQIPGFPEFPQVPGQSTTAKPDEGQSPNDPGNNGETQNPVLIPGIPAFPAFPPPSGSVFQNLFNVAAPAPVAVQVPVEQPQLVEVTQNDDTDTITVEARSAIQAAPIQLVQTVQAAPALTLSAIPAPAAPVRIEAFRPTPPFDQIVTKQAVLAPGRTNTQITPQVTQIQPEVTVRRVIQDVPVATPVIAQVQPQWAVAQPQWAVAAPGLTRVVAGPNGLVQVV